MKKFESGGNIRQPGEKCKDGALAWLYTASYLRRENLRKFARSDDEEVVAEAIRWPDECCAASGNSLDKANFMRIKAMLQQKTGDTRGAQISRDETEKHLQEFRKRKH